jgi:hypothetical protein
MPPTQTPYISPRAFAHLLPGLQSVSKEQAVAIVGITKIIAKNIWRNFIYPPRN